MILIYKLKEKLRGKESKIKVRGEISGTTWAEISMTNIRGEPIALGTPINDLKIGIQTLISGSISFSPNNYRIDNSHGFLHQHSGALVYPMENKTLSGSLLALFGTDYKALEGLD